MSRGRRRPMGSGSVTAHRGRFRAKLPSAFGRRSLGIYDTRAEAEAVLSAALEELAGRGLPGSATLEDVGQSWLDAREATHKRRTVARDRTRWAGRVSKTLLGRTTVDDISEADVRRWLAGLRRADGLPPSPTTLRNALSLVRGALEYAREQGTIPANPALAVRLPPPLRRRAAKLDAWTWLRAEELDAVLGAEAIPLRSRAAFATAAFAGLRAGELWGLRWDDVDEAGGVLRVRHSFEDTPKAHGAREVPILAPLAGWLGRWREAYDAARVYSPSGLVWPAKDGGHHCDGYDAGWARYREGLGLGRRVRLHDLRHTCASHLLQGTWSPRWIARALRLEEVRDWLGHERIEVTQRYAHLCHDAVRSLVPDLATTWPRDRSHLPESNRRPTVYETEALGPLAPVAPSSAPFVAESVAKLRARALEGLRATAAADPRALSILVQLAADVVEATAEGEGEGEAAAG